MPDSDVLGRLFGELATADLPVPAPTSVAARGRQRRRRARGRAAIAVAAVAVIVVGVTQFPRILSRAPALDRQHTPSAVCAAAPDAALRAQLRRALAVSRQRSVSVIAVSPDHAVLYLETTTADFHGIAAESVATGLIDREILPVPPTLANSVQGGLGPDGDVAWVNYSSVPGGTLPSTVIVWSPTGQAWSPGWARTGKPAPFPLEPAGQHTYALSAPVFSGAQNQLIAWEARANATTQEIVEADLLTAPPTWSRPAT
jgi:hypothetical protein